MKKRKILTSILFVVMCCGLLVALTACPPMKEFTGSPVSGITLNGESELELKSVDYLLNIIDWPDKHEFTNTNSTASIMYVISNSDASDIVAPLYLLVEDPQGYYYYDSFDVDSHCKSYQLTTSAACESVLRCVNSRDLWYYYDDNNASKVGKFLNALYDDRQTDAYYNSELLIYKYSYAIGNLSDEAYSLRFDFGEEYNELFFDKRCSITNAIFDDGNRFYAYLDESDTITLYSIGKELDVIEDKVEICDYSDNVIENGGQIAAVSSEIVTFDDVAMTYYDETSNLSETDWYNAVIAKLKDGWRYSYGLEYFDISEELRYMYQYTLTVPAQSEVSLTVQMPLYPTINEHDYTQYVFEYELDTSTLSNWKGDPSVSVSIATSGYYVTSSVELDETLTGFEIKKIYNGTEKVTFTLSRNPNVETVAAVNARRERRVRISALVVVCLCYSVPITVVAIVVGLDNAKSKKARTEKSDDTTATI